MTTTLKVWHRYLSRLLLQRRQREVALAVALTLAAIGFMAIALLRADEPGRASHISARKVANP